MPYQSPISPGRSWYEDTAGPRPEYPALDGDRTCDVVIVGGGFTGLSAAAHLAKAGTNVVLIEAHRLGDGASGRNGGQLGTGQRAWAEEMEAEYGFSRAKALFDLAEEAKAHLIEFAAVNKIDIDYMPGQMSVAHKRRYVDDYKAHAEIMASRFGYPHITFMDANETAERLGSTHYFGGTRDTGTGHIHPLKLLIGTAKVAAQAGAQLFEQTPSTGITSGGGKVKVTTPKGTITAAEMPDRRQRLWRHARAGECRAHHADRLLHRCDGAAGRGYPRCCRAAKRSTIPASSCVISANRRTDGCCSAGARSMRVNDPKDIHIHIRRQIAELYPDLRDVEITHGWGGYVGITVPRKPFVREVMPNVISAGGYSGHGVMLSNFFGKLYAETVAGNRDRLKLIEDLKIPAFPGGRRFRTPLLFLALNWFALRDRI